MMMNWDSQTIAEVTALAAVIVSPVVSLVTTHLQLRAQLVSANRQNRIIELRNTLAECLAKQATWILRADSRMQPEKETVASTLEDIQRLGRKVEMLLNPDEEDHKQLIMVVAEISAGLFDFYQIWDSGDSEKAERAKQYEVFRMQRKAVEISQRIFKREWNRITHGR